MLDRTPKIFISYSWESENTKNMTIELAEALLRHGIDVVLDVWDLKPGQDMYAFMERSVKDEEIDRVLMICDKSYAKKADSRKGGVGAETTVISYEVYNDTQQEKFIPIIIEVDDDEKPFLPAYLKSKMYINLSDEHYESGYNQLLRIIYEQPENRKPALGTPPEDIFKEEPTFLLPMREAVRKLEAHDFKRVNKNTADDFINLYLDSLKGFYRKDNFIPDRFLDDFRAMNENRSYFLKFLELLATSDKIALGEFLAGAFEHIYNTLCDLHFFEPQANDCNIYSFDIFKLHVWELFLCSMTYLLYHEMFSDIHDLLVHTYFLRRSPLSEETLPSSYGAFWFKTYELEPSIKKSSPELKQQITPIGHIICIEREMQPVYSRKAIAYADLFLFQILEGLELGIEDSPSWYPVCYIYSDTDYSIWQKLRSRKFCEKVFSLFGVQSIDALKQKISKCRSKPASVYDNLMIPALPISSFINVQDIGTLP